MAKIVYEISWWSNGKELIRYRVWNYEEYKKLVQTLKEDKVGFFKMYPLISFESGTPV